MKRSRNWLWPLLLLLAVAVAQAAKPPTAELTEAAQRIEAAALEQADKYAPVEWQFAIDKLAEAETLSADKKYKEAGPLAGEAAVDAELAAVRARAARARDEVARKVQSNRNLRQELLGAPAQ
ncbi:MAG: DUF4398 domain-containing protein [Lysobacterales bacterium]